MKKPYLILALILIVVVIVISIYVMKKSELDKKEFRNSVYNYQINYPSDWIINSNVMRNVVLGSSKKYSLTINMYDASKNIEYFWDSVKYDTSKNEKSTDEQYQDLLEKYRENINVIAELEDKNKKEFYISSTGTETEKTFGKLTGRLFSDVKLSNMASTYFIFIDREKNLIGSFYLVASLEDEDSVKQANNEFRSVLESFNWI